VWVLLRLLVRLLLKKLLKMLSLLLRQILERLLAGQFHCETLVAQQQSKRGKASTQKQALTTCCCLPVSGNTGLSSLACALSTPFPPSTRLGARAKPCKLCKPPEAPSTPPPVAPPTNTRLDREGRLPNVERSGLGK